MKMVSCTQIKDAVGAVSGRYGIKSAVLFGSYADGCANDASDVDLLVEFHSPRVSLITLGLLKCDLEDMLRLPVDIVHAPLPNDALITPDKKVALYES